MLLLISDVGLHEARFDVDGADARAAGSGQEGADEFEVRFEHLHDAVRLLVGDVVFGALVLAQRVTVEGGLDAALAVGGSFAAAGVSGELPVAPAQASVARSVIARFTGDSDEVMRQEGLPALLEGTARLLAQWYMLRAGHTILQRDAALRYEIVTEDGPLRCDVVISPDTYELVPYRNDRGIDSTLRWESSSAFRRFVIGEQTLLDQLASGQAVIAGEPAALALLTEVFDPTGRGAPGSR